MNYFAACTNDYGLSNMAKAKVQYQCVECGGVAPKWAGQCPDCHAWNTLTEIIAESSGGKSSRFREHAGAPAEVRTLDSVSGADILRISTGMTELDRAIGGGLVSGSVLLLGGDPGIGKSTLLIQVVEAINRATTLSTLYVSGEESAQQISLRGRRLGLSLGSIRLLTENHLERILSVAVSEKPGVLVIDSIQTIYTDLLQSAPGSVAQVRESAAQLVRYAKQTDTTVILIGHVTKEGGHRRSARIGTHGGYRPVF
jgi:Predicted ATP-dependent serine protease